VISGAFNNKSVHFVGVIIVLNIVIYGIMNKFLISSLFFISFYCGGVWVCQHGTTAASGPIVRSRVVT
jgi:hypothetical protein